MTLRYFQFNFVCGQEFHVRSVQLEAEQLTQTKLQKSEWYNLYGFLRNTIQMFTFYSINKDTLKYVSRDQN